MLRGILSLFAVLTCVVFGTQFLARGEAFEAVAEIHGDVLDEVVGVVLILGDFSPLRRVADVEGEIHVRVQGGVGIAAFVASYGAAELAVEGLVDYAGAGGGGGAVVLEMERVEHELHIFVCVLLLVAGQGLWRC